MVSTFDKLLAMIKEYLFDIVTTSETWLKDNPLRLQYVTIPGYSQVFRNHNRFRGGGVGAHLRDVVSYKRRTDIENMAPELEHLWIEIPGCNRDTWIDTVESLFSQLNVLWDGLLVVT